MPPPTRPAHALALLLVTAATAATLSACSEGEDEQTPAACLTGKGEYRKALAAAPGEVALDDGTPISECLPPEQEGGQLAQTGKLLVLTATELNSEAQRDPTGPAAIQLGYLVGAIERGADGIHADLVRRVNSAARFSPEGLLPPEFERTFGQGYAAGLESG